jgi:hypothetical protein
MATQDTHTVRVFPVENWMGPDVSHSYQSTAEIKIRGILPVLHIILCDVYKINISRRDFVKFLLHRQHTASPLYILTG